ncbi:MAG: hypothetical protein ACTHJ1_01695 [Bordetella sp.]|uniref:transglycosylase SLT domain-containing protein n=1 Tax=Bordetella sp. TaxID=28081 RepID=UPI003F7B4A4D
MRGLLLFLVPLLLLLGGCATTDTTRPRDLENLCAIFREKPAWHDAAIKARDKWGIPVPVPFAIMYQESTFRAEARPPRNYFLGLIPWGRVTSAYGYAQAEDNTWADYKRETGAWFVSRDNFSDSMDFMGWYMTKTRRLTGVPFSDAYDQYLSYHEGWTGYRRGTYKSKAWLTRVARIVQARASRFAAQYRYCP